MRKKISFRRQTLHIHFHANLFREDVRYDVLRVHVALLLYRARVNQRKRSEHDVRVFSYHPGLEENVGGRSLQGGRVKRSKGISKALFCVMDNIYFQCEREVFRHPVILACRLDGIA